MVLSHSVYIKPFWKIVLKFWSRYWIYSSHCSKQSSLFWYCWKKWAKKKKKNNTYFIFGQLLAVTYCHTIQYSHNYSKIWFFWNKKKRDNRSIDGDQWINRFKLIVLWVIDRSIVSITIYWTSLWSILDFAIV